jgi:uncharacterized coiled-coil protein SlyX
MLTELYNRFDFTFGAHTLEAYRRLPYGWDAPPPEFPYADLYMWRKFLAEPWCRARSVMVPTGICTQTHLRPHLTNRQRADELAYWRGESIKPEFHEMLWRKVAASFGRDLIRHETGHETAITMIKSQIAEHSRIRQELESQIAEHSRIRQELESQIAEHSRIRQELESQIATLEARVAESTGTLNDVSTQLSALRRSRLLKIGRVLRRLAGQAIPY